eukprot:scaffold230065_cov18-Tisochrysis_lutea.AAC.1
MPLVVMAIVSSPGSAFSWWHRSTRSGRNVGSPPVSRTLFTPASTNSRVCGTGQGRPWMLPIGME